MDLATDSDNSTRSLPRVNPYPKHMTLLLGSRPPWNMIHAVTGRPSSLALMPSSAVLPSNGRRSGSGWCPAKPYIRRWNPIHVGAEPFRILIAFPMEPHAMRLTVSSR